MDDKTIKIMRELIEAPSKKQQLDIVNKFVLDAAPTIPLELWDSIQALLTDLRAIVDRQSALGRSYAQQRNYQAEKPNGKSKTYAHPMFITDAKKGFKCNTCGEHNSGPYAFKHKVEKYMWYCPRPECMPIDQKAYMEKNKSYQEMLSNSLADKCRDDVENIFMEMEDNE